MSIDALIAAARMGDAALVKRLIERDPALANTRDRDGWTALHMAAAEGHADVIETVLRLGGEIDIVSYLDGTPLTWALQKGSLPAIRTLLDHGADPALVEEFEDGCVFETASPSAAEYLLRRYPEWIRKYHWGKTLLHRLAPLGNIGKLGVLLDLGAEIDAVAEDGRTALAIVADADRSEIRLETARFLLARGAAPDQACS